MRTALDLIPFFSESFSTNPKIYRQIDSLYKKDKIIFYKAARESEWYIHPIALEGSLEQEEYFKKSLGIFLNLEKYTDEIIIIIKKGWHYAYTYALNHNTIVLDEFLEGYIKKNKGLENINDDELNSNINMLFAIAAEKIDTSSNLYNSYACSLINRLEHYKKSNPTRISLDKATKDELIKIKDIRIKLLKKYGNIVNLTNTLIQKTNLKNYAIALDFIYDYENISLVSIVNNINFSERNIDELIYIIIMAFEDTNNIEEIGKILLNMIHIRYLSKAYKKAKEYHFNNNKETVYIELDLLQKQFDCLKEENLSLINNNIIMEKKITQLEKENLRLTSQLHEAEENKSELIALREFIFKLDKQIGNDSLNEKIDFNKLNQVKGLIIGGSDKWQRKLKVLLPGFKFIAVEALNFDKRILDDIDIVYIYTDYLNHALYYKLISLVKDKKIVYLHSNVNNDIVLNQIYTSII